MTDAQNFAALSRMAFGHVPSQLVHATVRLGIADALADGPMRPGELAARVDCDPGGVVRLLRALIILGLVEETPSGEVGLSATGRPLCSDHPRSIRSSVLLYGDPTVWQAWGALAHAVRTDTAAFDHVHGRPLFDVLADRPALSGVFNTAMREGTEWIAAEVPRIHDFAGAGTVADIGGGDGTLLAAVLAATPDVGGILFDSAEGTADAAETLRRAGLADRCAVESGDFFEAVPPADVMVLKGVLHDWADEQCVRILKNCRASIAPDGRLLVVEPVMPDRMTAPDAIGVVLSDIAMLVYTGGRERSRNEFQALLATAGFTLADVSKPLAGTAIRVLVARPA
jgi:orsellinic acid C2-O-methyltransferase